MDANLLLRDGSTNLTADETLTATKIGPMVRPMYLHVLAPYVRSGDTLDVEAEFCDTGATTTQISNMNMKQIVAAGHYCEPFFTLHDYIQIKLGVTAGTTAALSMGAVKVWIDSSARCDEPRDS
ncbi:MAG TPA: hypothetical protein VMG30_18885 [Acidobacteriota bacterium]|nr:hypothetical protein [Acidobacteriota bacterium]